MNIKRIFLGMFLALSLSILSGCGQPPTQTETKETKNVPVENQNQNSSAGQSESSENPSKAIVPLPSEVSIIQTFFNLIDEQRAADAISMMTPKATGNDTQKQAWGVQFNAFQKISAEKIEESLKDDWTDINHSYKVILNVQMKPEAAKAAIPNYGFENGENIRWVNLEKVDNLWKINGIATGP